MTLEQLATKVAMNKGYLSRIERGEKSPSVSALLRIAEALDVQVGHLFGETSAPEAITVVRRDEHLAVTGQVDEESLLQMIFPASGRRRLSAFLIEPGSRREFREADHPGDEMMYVLAGSIEVIFADRTIKLEAGDCIHFDGHLRHQVRRVGKAKAKALLVVGQDLSALGDK